MRRRAFVGTVLAALVTAVTPRWLKATPAPLSQRQVEAWDWDNEPHGPGWHEADDVMRYTAATLQRLTAALR